MDKHGARLAGWTGGGIDNTEVDSITGQDIGEGKTARAGAYNQHICVHTHHSLPPDYFLRSLDLLLKPLLSLRRLHLFKSLWKFCFDVGYEFLELKSKGKLLLG